MKRTCGLVLLILIVAIAGCSAVNTAVNTAADRAARQTGNAVGEAVGNRLGEMATAMVMARFPDTWTQQWMTLYTGYLFSLAFHSGSYAVTEDAYDPGEWTQWRMVDAMEPTPALVERAFLQRTDDNEEWWRVKYENTDDDEAIVLEGLFSADRGELLRLRAQFPGEEPKEMPVQEGTYGYSEPIMLTEASIEGATVGTETLSVPAGSFQTRHVRYGSPGSTLEWWLNDDVPGNLVKYQHVEDDAEASEEEAAPGSWTLELQDYGTGAQSDLGVL